MRNSRCFAALSMTDTLFQQPASFEGPPRDNSSSPHPAVGGMGPCPAGRSLMACRFPLEDFPVIGSLLPRSRRGLGKARCYVTTTAHGPLSRGEQNQAARRFCTNPSARTKWRPGIVPAGPFSTLLSPRLVLVVFGSISGVSRGPQFLVDLGQELPSFLRMTLHVIFVVFLRF